MFFAINALEPVETRGAIAFLYADGTPRLLIDIFLLGVFAAFYEVPLYASIQARTPEATRARVIAATNIINAFFMVLGVCLRHCLAERTRSFHPVAAAFPRHRHARCSGLHLLPST